MIDLRKMAEDVTGLSERELMNLSEEQINARLDEVVRAPGDLLEGAIKTRPASREEAMTYLGLDGGSPLVGILRKQLRKALERIEFLEGELHAWEETDAAREAGILPPGEDADRSEEEPLTDPRARLSPEAKVLLEKIAAKIEEEPEKTDVRFFRNLQGKCGTTYCIGGWAVALGDPEFLQEYYGQNFEKRAAELLGLDRGQGERLFFLYQWPKPFQWIDHVGDLQVGQGEEQGTPEYAKVVAERVRFFSRTEGTDVG